jgi:hypothetical protein
MRVKILGLNDQSLNVSDEEIVSIELDVYKIVTRGYGERSELQAAQAAKQRRRRWMH